MANFYWGKMFRFIIITLIVFLSADPIIARDKMIFSTFPDSDTPNIVIANTIISEVYNRLEMDIEVKYQPGYRALKQANTGKVDGLLFHVPGLGIPYANLIQVKAPVFHSQLVGFFNNKSIEIKDWDGLNRYRIGYVRGFVLVKNHLNDAQTVAVDEQEDMMKMLSKGRIDVAVDTYLTGLYTIKNSTLTESK